jgi:hypothetical protein
LYGRKFQELCRVCYCGNKVKEGKKKRKLKSKVNVKEWEGSILPWVDTQVRVCKQDINK